MAEEADQKPDVDGAAGDNKPETITIRVRDQTG
jgi:hypothetical protein